MAQAINNQTFHVYPRQIEFGDHLIEFSEITSLDLIPPKKVVRLFCKDAFLIEGSVVIDFHLITAEKTKEFAKCIIQQHQFTLFELERLNIRVEQGEGAPATAVAEFTLVDAPRARLFADILAPTFFEGYQIYWGNRTVRVTSPQGDGTKIIEKMNRAFRALNPYSGDTLNDALLQNRSPLFPGILNEPSSNIPSPLIFPASRSDSQYTVTYDSISKSVVREAEPTIKKIVFSQEKKQQFLTFIRAQLERIHPFVTTESEKLTEYQAFLEEIIEQGGPNTASEYEALKNKAKQYNDTIFIENRPFSPNRALSP